MSLPRLMVLMVLIITVLLFSWLAYMGKDMQTFGRRPPVSAAPKDSLIPQRSTQPIKPPRFE